MNTVDGEEAKNIDHMLRRALGATRGYILITIMVDQEEINPFIMSSLNGHDQVVNLLTACAEEVLEIEPEKFERGSQA